MFVDDKFDYKYEKVLFKMKALLNKAEYRSCTNDVREGLFVVVRIHEEGYYRGKIIKFTVETLSKL